MHLFEIFHIQLTNALDVFAVPRDTDLFVSENQISPQLNKYKQSSLTFRFPLIVCCNVSV
jgi:hypothetical protein